MIRNILPTVNYLWFRIGVRVVIEYDLTSLQTHYSLFIGHTMFTGQMTQPTVSIKQQALKDNSWSVHQVKGHQSHQAKPSTR